MDWKTAELGDLIHVKHGYAFEGDYFAEEGSYIVLTPGNFYEEGGFKSKGDDEKYYTGEVPEEYILSEGDLIVAMTEQAHGLLGSAAFVPDDDLYLHNQRLGLIQVEEQNELDQRFLYYLFNSYLVRSQISATASGTKVRHTSPSRIYETEVELPPLPVQQRIAGILGAYDDLIANNRRRIELLEEMATAIFREWFVHYRFPGHSDVEMEETEVGTVPKEWEICPFSDIADVLSGGTPKTSIQKYWDGPLPFFTPKEARGNFYVIDTERTLTEEGLENCRSEAYPSDTVFITARGTVGKVVMPAVTMAMNQSCYALKGKSNITQEFVFFAIREKVRALQKQAHGAVFDSIVMRTFDNIKIPKPPQPLIVDFTSRVAPALAQIRNLLQRNRSLNEMRDLLLPRLVTGEIDVEEIFDLQTTPFEDQTQTG